MTSSVDMVRHSTFHSRWHFLQTNLFFSSPLQRDPPVWPHWEQAGHFSGVALSTLYLSLNSWSSACFCSFDASEGSWASSIEKSVKALFRFSSVGSILSYSSGVYASSSRY